jgi:hypothetical protein
MSENAMFWTAMVAGQVWLCATALVWWRIGWRAALLLALGGPVLMLFSAFAALFVFFLVDMGRRPAG